jgi:hypothetical protein
MTLKLKHKFHESLDLSYDDQPLFRYVYQPDMPENESRKPYFHPVHTLGGNEVTCYRPHDHVWHKGIQLTMAHLSGQNFWGGNSYVHGEGYVQLPNNGGMYHDGWDVMTCDDQVASFCERLTWRTQAGEEWMGEVRRIDVTVPDPNSGVWFLDMAFELTNIRGEALVFGSPTTEGRPMAGYGGLFWRGPRSFRDGSILASDDQAGPDVMGKPASWLAYTGKHDGTGDSSTLIFVDHPDNLRHPNKWFVRDTPFACASFAFMFDEEYILPPGETLSLRYRIAIADDERKRSEIEALADAWQSS